VGLDMTCRDLQALAKKSGRPWEAAKSFDHSAPVSPITRSVEVLARGAIALDVNGARRQSADIADLIWSVPEIIAALCAHVALKAGDLIFTGTPAGVGPVRAGDRLEASIEGLGKLRVAVVAG
jgi:fumarylpyruvate hydrolase